MIIAGRRVPLLLARARSPRRWQCISVCRISIPDCFTALSGDKCISTTVIPDDGEDALAATGFPDEMLADPQLRGEVTGGLASRVSLHPAVRQALFDRQRAFATQPSGAVLDGRDMGTVIAPDADVKLFITASIEARARRRWLEMRKGNPDLTLRTMKQDIARRDARDMNREDAPLRPAADAPRSRHHGIQQGTGGRYCHRGGDSGAKPVAHRNSIGLYCLAFYAIRGYARTPFQQSRIDRNPCDGIRSCTDTASWPANFRNGAKRRRKTPDNRRPVARRYRNCDRHGDSSQSNPR